MSMTASVTISSVSDIRPAAEALSNSIRQLGGYRVIMSDNIASRRPMTDANGAILAEAVFGFTQADEKWWQDAQLALQSPIARACRYERSPFWVNADGFHTRHPNRYLDEIDLANFAKRAQMKAAIAVPVHLPFGQIGMAAVGGRSARCT